MLLARHRAFLVFAISTLVLFVLALTVWVVAGESWVERAWESQGGREYRFLKQRGVLFPNNLVATQRHAQRAVEETLALFASGFALVCVLYVLVRGRPGLGRGAALVVVWWLGVETLAAPFLVRRLLLNHYEFVRDPDHWPEGAASAPGWNSDGLAQDDEASDYSADDFVILFLGDSFTYGYRLKQPHVDAFPHVVGRRLSAAVGTQVKIANFGWTSSSPLLSRRRLEAIGAGYDPDLVVLCVDMTDARDDLWYQNLIERRGLCALFDRLPITIRLLRDWTPDLYRGLFEWSTGRNQPYLRYFACEAPLDETRPYLATLGRNIAACAEAARALDCDFEVFVLPRYFQYTADECPDDREQQKEVSRHSVLGPYSAEPFRWFDEYARTVDFPVHSLLEVFAQSDERPHCYADDSHWTKLGHRIAADAIARQLEPTVVRRRAERGSR